VLDLINELGTVDENLDWLYQSSGNTVTWKIDKGDKQFEIMLDRANPKSLKIETFKTIKASGRQTKVSAHSHTKLTNSNVLSKLKKAFREL
jgi:hypothetical protein